MNFWVDTWNHSEYHDIDPHFQKITKTFAIKYIEDGIISLMNFWVDAPLEDIELLNIEEHGAETVLYATLYIL